MGFSGLGIGASASASALVNVPIYVTQTMIDNRLVQLPSKPVGAVVLYIDGCLPQLGSVAFNVTNNTISWDAGSWLDVNLIVGEAVYFVYATVAERALHLDIVTITSDILSNNSLTLTSAPAGVVTMYIDGTSALISGVSFIVSGAIVSWPPTSWLATNLNIGENVYLVY